MSLVNPTLAELADSAMEKLRNGAARNIPDAALKARVGRGLKTDRAKVREIVVELNHRAQANKQAFKEAIEASKARSQKVGG